MQEYNDYIITTRRWLQYYNRFKAAIDCMVDDLKTIEEELEDGELAAPIAKYGDMPAGGNPELNAVERATDRRIKLQSKRQKVKSDIGELRRVTHRVDRALNTLDEETKGIIKGRFIDGYSWEQVAIGCHMSESGTRKRGNRALSDLALVMFGVKVRPEQLSFVFFE